MMMKMVSLRRGVAWVVVILLAMAPAAAQACSVCYGEPDSPAARGLTWAILSLIVVVAVVLAGVTAFFVHAGRNSLTGPLLSEER